MGIESFLVISRIHFDTGDNQKDTEQIKYPVKSIHKGHAHSDKYDPENKDITIYLRGIKRATEDEVNNPGYNNLTKSGFFHMLLKMVILHEIGHFWFDKFIDEVNYEVATKLEMNKNYD